MEIRLGLDGLLMGKLTPVFDASPGELKSVLASLHGRAGTLRS